MPLNDIRISDPLLGTDPDITCSDAVDGPFKATDSFTLAPAAEKF